MYKCFLSAFFLLVSSASIAAVRLPKIFGDSMVLQRDHPIPIWGWADRNEKITVLFHQQTKTATANADGLWKLQLNPEAAGGPYKLVVKGETTNISLSGILTGDVWICSGQSNMEFKVGQGIHAADEIQQAAYPQIRHFTLPHDISPHPLDDTKSESNWKSACPANVKDFTAVGYFFARELNQALHIPIGLIHTSWGGTDIETWISNTGFKSSEAFNETIGKLPSLNIDSLMTQRRKASNDLIRTLQGTIPASGVSSTFKANSFDDQAWPKMKLPSYWEQQQLKDFDGVVWFRKTVTVSAAVAGKQAVLHLSPIDDSDSTYVNGQLIGSTRNEAGTKRVYSIPAGLLKEGKNVIAVRVEDTGGNGGIAGNGSDMSLNEGDSVLPLAGEWNFQVESVGKASTNVGPNSYPSLLYNAMINPIIPFGIKGAIWYQGENNAGRAYEYRTAFPLMISDWRRLWNQGNFPFYFVQLASFKASGGTSKNGSSWAELREAQTLTLSLPNTGMAVTTDVGESNDIHPKNKQDVGKRLAAVALHDTYGKKIVYMGPVYASMKTDGSKAVISFTQTGQGLVTKDNSSGVTGFEIAGADQQFYTAKARIEGGHVTVYADEVSSPAAVRYSWADDAGTSNLFNKEGFPAGPFRTDQWKEVTRNAKYRVR